jgi:hypothetical protein
MIRLLRRLKKTREFRIKTRKICFFHWPYRFLLHITNTTKIMASTKKNAMGKKTAPQAVPARKGSQGKINRTLSDKQVKKLTTPYWGREVYVQETKRPLSLDIPYPFWCLVGFWVSISNPSWMSSCKTCSS